MHAGIQAAQVVFLLLLVFVAAARRGLALTDGGRRQNICNRRRAETLTVHDGRSPLDYLIASLLHAKPIRTVARTRLPAAG